VLSLWAFLQYDQIGQIPLLHSNPLRLHGQQVEVVAQCTSPSLASLASLSRG